jgi:hypothetical protein
MRIAGLLAGAALWLLASHAHAGFSTQILNNPSGDGIKIQENSNGTFSLIQLGGGATGPVTWTANAGSITYHATVDGYRFDVTVKSNQDASPTPSTAQMSVNATMTALQGAKATNFSYYASDNPFGFPSPSNGNLYLTASVFSGSVYAKDELTFAQGQYTVGNTHYTTTHTGTLNGPNQSSNSNTVVVPSSGSPFALSDVGGTISTTGHLGTIHFWSQAVTAMPEPAGVLLGLLGVSCMGVTFLARRRLTHVPA